MVRATSWLSDIGRCCFALIPAPFRGGVRCQTALRMRVSEVSDMRVRLSYISGDIWRGSRVIGLNKVGPTWATSGAGRGRFLEAGHEGGKAVD